MQTSRYSPSLLHRHGFLFSDMSARRQRDGRLTAADNETAVPDAVATAGWPAEHGRLEAGPGCRRDRGEVRLAMDSGAFLPGRLVCYAQVFVSGEQNVTSG